MKEPEHYCIWPDYIQRKEVVPYARCKKQSPRRPIKQPFVYHIAQELVNISGAAFILDLGCGNGFKLSKFRYMSTIGIDQGPNYRYCKTLPFGQWIEFDLDTDASLALPAKDGIGIFSDVVEHLIDPDHIMLRIKNWLLNGTLKAVVLSTPERERTYAHVQTGPPDNVQHIREWTMDEMEAYLRKLEIPIAVKGLTADRDNCSNRVHYGDFDYSYPNGLGKLPPFRTSFFVLSANQYQLTEDKERWEIL